ncbi:MAG: hypothetical protein H0V96_00730 [Acidimicrobiia bacterium]|nr:hypothetical protein [Acidimicrobiia bacterium]
MRLRQGVAALMLAAATAGCSGDTVTEPAEVEDCDGLVEVGSQLVRAYADLLDEVRIDDFVDGEPIAGLDELERIGGELDASVTRLGCDAADLNRRISAEVGDLITESPAGSVLLEVVRRGVITTGTTPTPAATTTTPSG